MSKKLPFKKSGASVQEDNRGESAAKQKTRYAKVGVICKSKDNENGRYILFQGMYNKETGQNEPVTLQPGTILAVEDPHTAAEEAEARGANESVVEMLRKRAESTPDWVTREIKLKM